MWQFAPDKRSRLQNFFSETCQHSSAARALSVSL
jgi:hypothetical protein